MAETRAVRLEWMGEGLRFRGGGTDPTTPEIELDGKKVRLLDEVDAGEVASPRESLYRLRGHIAHTRGETDEAVRQFRSAILAGNADPALHDWLGEHYLANGNHAEAAAVWQPPPRSSHET